MKSKLRNNLLVLALSFGSTILPNFAAPSTAYPDGFYFDKLGTPVGNIILAPFDAGNGQNRSIELSSYIGGLFLYSGNNESAAGILDGGVNIYGNPISLVLGNSVYNQNPDDANLNVWKASTWGVGQPLFNINGLSGNTTFTNSNVAVNNGSLMVSGSSVVTAASAPSILGGQGFIQTSSLTTALNGMTSPPDSAAWTNYYVKRGNIGAGGGLLALGSGQATALGAVALSNGSSATGLFSLAQGPSAAASAIRSIRDWKPFKSLCG